MTTTKTSLSAAKPASPLPWSLRVVPVGSPDSALPKSAAVWLGEADYVAVLAADGTVVCDNANYYPAAIKPEDAAYIATMAEREAALIAERDALAALHAAVVKNGEWDDGCFYYEGRWASELQHALSGIDDARAEARKAQVGAL